MTTKARWRNNMLEFYDSSTQERTAPVGAPVVFYDDFLGAGKAVIPVGGSAESGMAWAQKIVGAAPPTVAGVADAANGVVACTLTADVQAQTAALYMDDQRQFSLEQGLVFECRVKISVLPTLVAECVWGLAGDYNAVPDTVTYSAFFTADGTGEIFCEMDDNATDRSTTSGVTATAAQWKIYRIDATTVGDVLYYIDGVHVATGTTFAYAATGANAILQPFFSCYKASGAGLGTLQIDYVRIWQQRS
jgi:hypothetical protein